MPQRRLHFVDLAPPEMIWLAAGSASAGAVRQVSAGHAAGAGAVVAGVEHTSTVAVTPLAGTVGEVETVNDSRGREQSAVCVQVAPDAAGAAAPKWPAPPLSQVTREELPEWIDRLERAGVRADRHNSPDLIAQLLEARRRPIDSIVCHALEADPTLPVQVQWALRHPIELRDGLRLLARLTGARRTILAAAEGDNRRLFRHLRRSARAEAARQASMVQVPLGAGPPVSEATDDRTGRQAASGTETARPPLDVSPGDARPRTSNIEVPGAQSGGQASNDNDREQEPEEIHDIGEGESVVIPFDPKAQIREEDAPVTEAVAEALLPSRFRKPALPTSLGLRIIPVRNAYPQADPTLLVWALLARRLPPGRSPTEAGALVLDAVAAIAVGAVARGAAVIQRQPLAVRDHRRDISVLADIWRGSRASDVLRELGMIDEGSAPPLPPGEGVTKRAEGERVTGEGEEDLRTSNIAHSRTSNIEHPTSNIEVPDRALRPSTFHVRCSMSALPSQAALRGGDFLRASTVPLDCILDGGEVVLHLTEPVATVVNPEPCIRCGWCLDICPTHVHPAGVLEAAQREDADIARQYGASACIECGLCSYICPSRLPLLEAAQMMKGRG